MPTLNTPKNSKYSVQNNPINFYSAQLIADCYFHSFGFHILNDIKGIELDTDHKIKFIYFSASVCLQRCTARVRRMNVNIYFDAPTADIKECSSSRL